jgi:hypothetical protein
MGTNTRNVEEQKTEKDSSTTSSVKTPLVDALRRYFFAEEVAKGIVETDKASLQNLMNLGFSNG